MSSKWNLGWKQIIIDTGDGKKIIHNLDEAGRASAIRSEIKDSSIYYYYRAPSVIKPHRVILSATVEGYAKERFFSHGFQSWSPSALLGEKDRQEYTGSLFKPLARYVSGQHIFDKALYPGYQMSWNFTYWYSSEEDIFFCGSLDESNAYTAFYFRPETGHLIINRDWEGMEWPKEEEICLASFYIGSGEKDRITEAFFTRIKEKSRDWSFAPRPKKYKGWTSWYQYYDKIDEKICRENLLALAPYSSDLNIFQIDDGYQTKTGDWLSTNEKFSSGMQSMAKEISSMGMKPGLWLAPFTAVSHAEIARNHPAYFIKNARGKPLAMAYNTVWKGNYFGLNILDEEVQQYLQNVFHTIIHQWGYTFLKLDFLFCAGAQPHSGYTRAQLMDKALLLLRQYTAGAELLLCGVPIAPAWGKTDFCRIGNDIHLDWEFAMLKTMKVPERPSTFLSLQNTMARFMINGKGFMNDPDVFILRDLDQKMDFAERKTLFLINWLMGALVFTSDKLADYNTDQKNIWRIFMDVEDPVILRSQMDEGIVRIQFIWHKVHFYAVANLSDKTTSFSSEQSASPSPHSLRPHQAYIYTLDTDTDEMAKLLLEIYGA